MHSRRTKRSGEDPGILGHDAVAGHLIAIFFSVRTTARHLLQLACGFDLLLFSDIASIIYVLLSYLCKS